MDRQEIVREWEKEFMHEVIPWPRWQTLFARLAGNPRKLKVATISGGARGGGKTKEAKGMVSDVSESWNKLNKVEDEVATPREADQGADCKQSGGVVYSLFTSDWMPSSQLLGDIGQPLEAGNLERARRLIREALKLIE